MIREQVNPKRIVKNGLKEIFQNTKDLLLTCHELEQIDSPLKIVVLLLSTFSSLQNPKNLWLLCKKSN